MLKTTNIIIYLARSVVFKERQKSYITTRHKTLQYHYIAIS